ncbi:MAG: hypothetical protein ABSA02_19920 [Trebonia sp.]|jgi:hypothetical protein
MNDLDTNTLRRALRVTQDPGYPSPGGNGRADIAGIVARGRRLRWRRRAVATGGSLCLAAAVAGAVAGIGRLTTPSSGPAQHTVSPVSPTRAVLVPTPSPGRGHVTPWPSPSATAVPTSPSSSSPLPTATALPTPTTSRTQPTPTPTLRTTTGASSGHGPSSPPSASAASTYAGQPSATPSATG